MAATREPSDAQLLTDIRDLFDDLDPVPPGLEEGAKFAIALTAMHAELAEITAAGPLLVRDRIITHTATTFKSSALTLLVVARSDPDGSVRLDGWVTTAPAEIGAYADPDPLLLPRLAPAARTHADANGRFVITGLRPGQHVFVVRAGDHPGAVVLTPPLAL